MAKRKGCRPLQDDEIALIDTHFDSSIGSDKKGGLERRNYTLMMFSIYIGARISETLSLDVEDVLEREKIADEVYFQKKNTKGEKQGRKGVITDECKKLLSDYIMHYQLNLFPKNPLFFSKKGGRLSINQARYIMKGVFKAPDVDITGKLSTHTTRKTFARICYEDGENSIPELQECLGHSAMTSTLSYMSHSNEKVNKILNNISLKDRIENSKL